MIMCMSYVVVKSFYEIAPYEQHVGACMYVNMCLCVCMHPCVCICVCCVGVGRCICACVYACLCVVYYITVTKWLLMLCTEYNTRLET